MAAINFTLIANKVFTLDPTGAEIKELVSTPEKKKNRIGEYKKVVLNYTSSQVLNSMNVYVNPAFFFPSASPLPFSYGTIPSNCWVFQVDEDATPGVYNMTLQAAVPYAPDLIKNDKVQFEVVDDNEFKIHLYFFQIYDTNNYLSPGAEDNKFKLLKDKISSSSILEVSGTSIYNSPSVTNVPKFYFFFQDSVDPTNSGSKALSIGNYGAAFYNKNEAQGDPYFSNPRWTYFETAINTTPNALQFNIYESAGTIAPGASIHNDTTGADAIVLSNDGAVMVIDATNTADWNDGDACSSGANTIDIYSPSVLIYLAPDEPTYIESPVDGLMLAKDTRVKFKIESPTDPTSVFVWMIRTNNSNNSVDMKTNYEASFVKLTTDGTSTQKDNKIYSPTSALVEVGGEPGNYECFFTVNKDLLSYGYTYRFIAIVYLQDDDYSIFEVNSFISEEQTATSLPVFTGDGYEIAGKIKDYQKEFTGNDLVCVIEERLKSIVSIDYSDNAFANDIAARLGFYILNDIRRYLVKVKVEVFEDQGSGVVQYFDRLNAIKIDPTTYSIDPGLSLIFDSDTLEVNYDFRVRYEEWLANIETRIYGVPLITPNDNQKWAGRILTIETSFELFYDDYTNPFSDLIKFRQTIRPKNYATDTLYIYQDDDTEIADYYVNDADPCLKAYINIGLDKNDYYLLTTVEKEPGLSPTVEENEEWTGVLPKLDSNKFIGQQIGFGVPEYGVAKFCLSANEYFVNSPYKISAIAKLKDHPEAKEFEDGEEFRFEDNQIYDFE